VLVLGASAAVQVCLTADGFGLFGSERLKAPALLWSEVSSVLHEMRWRREISAPLADIAFGRLLAAPLSPPANARARSPRSNNCLLPCQARACSSGSMH